MRENIVQPGKRGNNQRIYIDNDWFHQGLPPNVVLSDNVYLDTSYGFSLFHSQQKEALVMEEASGCYDVVSFMLNEEAKISVGKFSMLNGNTIICNKSITIGDHCMLAWGSLVTDTWLDISTYPVEVRKIILQKVAADPLRKYPVTGMALPVVLEDNCWIGFDSVVMPGVRVGKGSIVGCKSVVTEDVPAYAIVTGSPARVVRYLDADDTEACKKAALDQYVLNK